MNNRFKILELLIKHVFIVLQSKKIMNYLKCNSSIKVKSCNIKERQSTKTSIPLGMQRSVEKVSSLSTHPVRDASNTTDD